MTSAAKNNPAYKALIPVCLNEFEAAKYINMSVSFLRYHRQHGFIDGKAHGPRYVKLGKSIRYRMHDLNDWLTSNLCPGYENSKNTISLETAPRAAN